MEDLKDEQTLKKTIENCIKRKDVYLESIKKQRKNLLEIISDYRDMIDTFSLLSVVTREDIDISPHLDNVPASSGLPSDPVYRTVEKRDVKIRDDKIKEYYNKIKLAEKGLEENLKAQEEALLIINIYHGTQAVIPAHYYVCNQLWYTREGTFKSVALDLKISTDKVKVMLKEEVEAIYYIVKEMTAPAEITPLWISEILQKAPEKLYDKLIRNER